ncbi:protein translocase subunit SecF [Parvularcula oceani]|uniref:protein translocase subunit SecF n=1 Tax=Parvularcula oceani TaxID=1247963 RepID=UPI0004E28692|nr:protein translocase subunit SecF [Parvularcula oceani]
MAFSLVPDDTHIPFTRFATAAQIGSLVAILASVAAFFLLGLNFGIDFRGGVTVEVGPAPGAEFTASDLTEVRSAVDALGLGDVRVQNIGGGLGDEAEGIVVFVEEQPVSPDAVPAEGQIAPDELQAADPADAGRAAEIAQQRVAEQVRDTLAGVLGADISYRRVDVVGPTVSGELVERGVTALVVAITMMLVYIWFRFEWQFSLGAILALVHDVILTIGMFAVTQLDFTLSIIAALLTIVGYSMNDTVVVYDRVRENLRKFKRKPLAEVIDLSINQTLARTIMTSLTTLLALGSLFLFGGDVLRGFSFAMIWGIVIGTYSSIFIASPALLRTGVKREWDERKAEAATATP